METIRIDVTFMGDTYREDSENFIDAVYDTHLKELKVGLERPIEETDVANEIVKIECNLRLIHEFLVHYFDTPDCEEVFSDFSNKEFKSETIVTILLVCGEHSNEEDVWTSNITVDLSKSIVDILCKHYSCSCPEELIRKNGFSTRIFNNLQRKLVKNTWKCFPAAVSSYVWALLKIQFPEMGKILYLIMPFVLILLDDYEVSYRIRGLACFQHIIENITHLELSGYCEGYILFKTLHLMLYNMESTIVRPLIRCFVVILNKIVPREDMLKWTYYDDILSVWLVMIEPEQMMILRKEHMESLPVFLESMGLSCVRWSETLIRIFEQYCSIPDDRERSFKALYVYMKVTWPRVHCNFHSICMIIMKSLLDLVDTSCRSYVYAEDALLSEQNEKNSLNAVVECLNLLKLIVPDEFKSLCREIIDEPRFGQSFKAYLRTS